MNYTSHGPLTHRAGGSEQLRSSHPLLQKEDEDGVRREGLDPSARRGIITTPPASALGDSAQICAG